jgi:hypothetical protein
MDGRGFIGIERDNTTGWVVVKRVGAQIRQCKSFNDTPTGIARLTQFIRESCNRPKIGLRSNSRAALKLIEYIRGIPDVEVVLISDAGLRTHRAWLPLSTTHPYMQRSANDAEVLARCAERMF